MVKSVAPACSTTKSGPMLTSFQPSIDWPSGTLIAARTIGFLSRAMETCEAMATPTSDKSGGAKLRNPKARRELEKNYRRRNQFHKTVGTANA